MISRVRLGRLAALALFVVLGLAAGVPAAHAATISGTVSDSTGAALSQAVVRVEGMLLRGITDENGAYSIANVPAGTVVLRAMHVGHKSANQVVTVAATDKATANFTLKRVPFQAAQVDVVVGSRATHTAAEELAVPVDIFTAAKIASQGSSETGAILQSLSQSVNFPRQSVTDATDVVRPFTMRGLSPDHTLVLVDGNRRHNTALVNTFAYGTNAGSSGVDLNAIPSSAIGQIEVLRDGASAQYGSDAIAGVVNVVTRKGRFAPFVSVTGGRYMTKTFKDDGNTGNINGGVGLGVGRGSLGLFAEVLDRQPTDRAWADPYDVGSVGVPDSIDANGQIVEKRNKVTQPNQHWGDGLERDILTYGDLRLPVTASGLTQFYLHGGYSFRRGAGQGYKRYTESDRNWPTLYPEGYLPEFHPDVVDYNAATGIWGVRSGWKIDASASIGHNDFQYNLRNTMNVSLGPCLGTPCAPGLDGVLGTDDDPNIPNKTSFFAGAVKRDEIIGSLNASKEVEMGLRSPVNVAWGGAYRYEKYGVQAGELASYIDGGHVNVNGDDAPGGSQVFPGFSPSDAVNAHRSNVGLYTDWEADLTSALLANAAARYEHYSDFGDLLTGKFAARVQPSRRVTLRGAVSTGFRAPGLGQINWGKVVTNVISGEPEEIGVFPVDHPAARLLGSKPLKAEKSVNLSAGLALTPVNGFTITADYFNIKLNDRIILGATFDDSVTRAILAGGGYGNIAGVQYFTNGLDTRTTGLDVTGTWNALSHGDRTLNFTGAANYTHNTITSVDPLPAELAGSSEPGLLDTVTRVAITEERPDWRLSLTSDYAHGAYHAMARGSYYGTFASAQPGYCDDCREAYGAKTLFDTEVGYKVGNADVSLGARNIFDTYPDKATLDYNNNFGTFPWAAASPFGYNGRYVYLRVNTTLGK